MRHLALIATLIGSSAVAAPTTLHQSGRLLDAAGGPLNDAHDLAFSLFRGQSGGGALWTEDHPSVSLDAGYFDVDLGGVTALSDAVLDTPALWLEISVDGAPMPRLALASVPFARHAALADAVRGATLSSLLCTAGQIPALVGGTWGCAEDRTLTASEVRAAVSGANLTVGGSVRVGADATTCTGANAGAIRFENGLFEGCDGSAWTSLAPSYGSATNPAQSCLAILQRLPNAVSGDYTIIPPAGGAPITVYCDMVADGGGYTYYPVTNGASSCGFPAPNDCKTLGMDIVMPRSIAHWKSMLAKYGGAYFAVIPGVYRTTGSGSYAGCIMRDAATYGSGCSDWRVGDGGAWWVRDTAFSEPNGDYTAGCWLGISTAGYTVTAATLDAGQGFNDGGCAYCTTSYICSTNDK